MVNEMFTSVVNFLVLTLIFYPHHAILTPVTKPLKTRSYKGFADSRRKMNRVFVTFHS